MLPCGVEWGDWIDAIHFTHFTRITQKGHIEIVFWQIVVQKVFEIFAPSHFLIPPPTVFSSEANAHVGYST